MSAARLPDLSVPASLLAHPTRAAVLVALLDGTCRPAGELCRMAGVSPQAGSNHLAALLEGGLLRVHTRGRRRYYELASPATAVALEGLCRLAPARGPLSSQAERSLSALRLARACYDHLAGVVGVGVTAGLATRGVLVLDEDAGALRLDSGAAGWLTDNLGIDLSSLPAEQRRARVRWCLDWTERRPHLAGSLGAALLHTLLADGWLMRMPHTRALHITPLGRRELAKRLDVRLDDRI